MRREQIGQMNGRKGRLAAALLVLLVYLLGMGFSVTAGGEDAGRRPENLLVNGSFEDLEADGLPAGWYLDAYVWDEGYTLFGSEAEGGSPDGGHCVTIENKGLNDARFAQVVEVEPESLYCFSGYIRGSEIQEGRGANLSIEGLYTFSESVYDSAGEWRYIEWYGETGEDQRTVTLFARLGGYSGESLGKAWFDGLRLEKVQVVPGDGVADLWYSQRTVSHYDDESAEAGDTGTDSPAWPRLILLTLLYTVVAAILLLRRREDAALSGGPAAPGAAGSSVFLAVGLLSAFVLRLVLSYFVEGYSVDVGCFVSWGHTMASSGPVGFYPDTSFCDYPPAYTWVLGLNSLLCDWFGANEGMRRVIFRFLPCLCDLAAIWVVRDFALKRQPGLRGKALDLFCVLLAWNPALILNSACWGQMDSVLCFLLLLVALLVISRRWEIALPVYMLSVLVKPQALMLGFLGLAAMILEWLRVRESRRKMCVGIAAALGVALVIVIPFSIRQSWDWLFKQYATTLASYPYATVNTANFYYLLDGNWSKIENAAPLAASLLLMAGCLGYGAAWTWRARRDDRPCRWIEQSLIILFAGWFLFCALTSASWGMVGTAAMAFAFLIVLSLYIRKGDISFLPYLGGLLFILLYVFGVKMHERYIFPAFFLLAAAWVIHRDRRIVTVLLLLTAATFLNEGIVLDNSIRLGAAQGHLNNDTTALADLLAVLQVLTAGFAVHTGLCLGVREPVPPRALQLFRDSRGDNLLHWKRKDTLILTGILAVYSLICFPTLGSTKAPQTAWTSTEYEESVTLDLGEHRDSFVMLYFARVSRYDFSVQVSEDGKSWSDETWAEMAQGQCWKWKYVTESSENEDGTRSYASSTRHWFAGRYVRLTAHQVGLALCEVILRDENGKQLPVTLVGRENGDPASNLYSDPARLIDEQDTLEALPMYFPTELKQAAGEENPGVAQPSWWNSTYFDEIYHARTAWEFLQASAPYETSHPPLGKILMSWGVAIFGMTPFGWRFAGALAGVAMLAGMYLIGKQLTKRTAMGALMSGLMALDCMHFTQTQIATIDSFPVLFIIFSFFFMLRFLQTDLSQARRSRLLTDLGLSGLFIGLAIASKWIGLYAGAGLAVLFFTHCGRFLRRERRKPVPGAGRKAVAARPLRLVLILCAWCVLFFIVVPVVIYLLSYIPYFAYRHTGSLGEYLENVWNTQRGMLSYHATPGLGMDHPFYSPWYEWPVIGKPMFYATKQYLYFEGFSHSIFCIGNPVIWLLAIPAMALCALAWIQGPRRLSDGPEDGMNPYAGLSTSLLFLLVGFLAQYLPWMLVPRGTYIYHYFASVPFLIIALGLVTDQLRLRARRAGYLAAGLLLLLSLIAFVLFFPYVSGILAPTAWLDLGRGLLKIWY